MRLGFREDVDTVLGAADAVAVPSTRPEPLGLVALEAGAAGLPVVASADGGVAEVVRDGVSGLLVAPAIPRPWPPPWRAWRAIRRAARLGREGARLVAAEHARSASPTRSSSTTLPDRPPNVRGGPLRQSRPTGARIAT